MARISLHKIISSSIEKLKNRIELLNHDLDSYISESEERKERKIKRFISNKEDELYLKEIAFSDIDLEVNKRIVRSMLRYNKKDYWARREAIQNWRKANKTEEATKEYYNTLNLLDQNKKEYESNKREIIKQRLLSVIVTDQLEKEKLANAYKTEVIKAQQDIEDYKINIENITAAKIEKKQASFSKRVSLVEKIIKFLESKLDNVANSDYTLDDNTVLEVKNLTMQFGGLKAVDNLSFKVKKGEVFGLIGPNGAGKTTVFNCITQFYKPTAGQLYFKEKHGNTISLTDYVVHNVIKKGIVRTFQNVEVVKEISVLDNLLIAAHTQYKSNLFTQFLHLPKLRREEKQIRRKAFEVLEFMGLTSYANWLAWGLPYGILKKIEIARTLMNNPQLIILDEPAAGLNDTETAELSKLIKKIQEKYNCSILLVEHDMGLVMEICDTVCAISFGKLLAIGSTEEIQANKDVQAAYLGTAEEE